MSPSVEECEHANAVERGHCKCCCEKWHPVKKKRNGIGMRRYIGPRYRLMWEPRRRCTCQKSHHGGQQEQG
jgi:hypothetical protein